MGGLLVAEEKLFGVEAPLRSAGLLLVTGALVAGAVVAGAVISGALFGCSVLAAIGENSGIAAPGMNTVAETSSLIDLLGGASIPVDPGFAPGAAASGLDAALDAAGGLVLAAVAASGCV